MAPTVDSVFAAATSPTAWSASRARCLRSRTPRRPADAKVGKKPQAGKPVKVTVSCDEACSVDLTGKAKPKGSKQGNLKPASTDLGAGASATLKLKPKGKLKKALRRAGKGKATIEATATDASGNAADATAKAKLK